MKMTLRPAATAGAEPEPAEASPEPAAEPAGGAAESNANEEGKFSLAELQAGTPAGVKPKEKENALRDGDFPEAFGMGREAFFKLVRHILVHAASHAPIGAVNLVCLLQPKWKHANLKKKAKIF
jgi:hypothetical protein